MAINRGDRVIATEPLGGIIFSTVPKGTKGVVSDVEGILSIRYTVHFENGCTETCTDRQIERLNRGWW